jgi:transcription antitermination factor NusG
MPGYIFADLTDDAALDTARGNHAVISVMCRDGRPVKAPALAIGWLIFLEWTGAFDATLGRAIDPPRTRRGRKRTTPLRNWRKGQRVMIAEGSFRGFVGEVAKADRADRMELLIDVFGRPTPIELDEVLLEGWDQP